jgi:hypothetical protein
LNSFEAVFKIFKVHPEDTVICFFIIQHLLKFVGPEIWLIAPVSVPLMFTPWISDFQKLKCFALVLNFLDINDSISMTSN